MVSPFNPSRKFALVFFGLLLLIIFYAAVLHHSSNNQTPETQAAALKPTSSPTPITCANQLKSKKVVGIQAGHYKIDELPKELTSLHWDFGASAGGINEVDVNLDIAQKTVDLLQSKGISAVVLPATVPPDYCASAFVAIHADGNDVSSVYGYKVAPSMWDTDGKAELLSDNIRQDYETATAMRLNPTITDNMTQYYAFNYQKFTHTLDPQTPGALIEVGFITNISDRAMMTKHADSMAKGIANGIIDYLNGTVAPTLEPSPTL